MDQAVEKKLLRQQLKIRHSALPDACFQAAGG